MEFERVSTGIPELDTVLSGGIPKGNLTLLAGPPGSGKSTIGAQFLAAGARNGEPSVYISIGEDADRVARNLKSFNWGVEEMIDDGTLSVVSPDRYDFKELIHNIEHQVQDLEAERLFIDSITVLKSFFENEFAIRQKIIELRQLLDSLSATTMATAESPNVERPHNIGVEEYVADGVISVHYQKEKDTYQRYLAVKKMRGTEHDMRIHPITITRDGVSMEG